MLQPNTLSKAMIKEARDTMRQQKDFTSTITTTPKYQNQTPSLSGTSVK